ncbi:Hypothetical_protein [Hexamita inflata]|uniref:Hypothetical_protein n=1 Tax=Hexamita inflata TaxID=28002 RepID=A0AA86UU60_9EUKA|nr:Hypothetical protein HINF_LOCUS55724 [Hexamita inflata]
MSLWFFEVLTWPKQINFCVFQEIKGPHGSVKAAQVASKYFLVIQVVPIVCRRLFSQLYSYYSWVKSEMLSEVGSTYHFFKVILRFSLQFQHVDFSSSHMASKFKI